MAQLPRGRAQALAAGLALLLALAPGLARADFDLSGAWHVLVHYTDDHSSHPEQVRWLDWLWVFEHKSGKLQWTEYPIVVFNDDEGRFERRQSGQYARVLGGWEPSEAQLANIHSGLATNTRGMKKKKLRGSDAEGWGSTSRARPASASVITYQENWSVTRGQGLPVFVQQDVMASVRAETLEGTTKFETLSLEPGGVLAGSYERDGIRHGTFRMRRAGGRLGLEKRDQSELQRRASVRELQSDSALARELRGLGVTAERIEGEPPDWLQRGAEHDDSVRYGLPFGGDVPRKVYIGYRGSTALYPLTTGGGARSVRQTEEHRYTLVFATPKGTPVVAARAGRVVEAVDNRVSVLHADGSLGSYWPVGSQEVKADDEVTRGQGLGSTGAQRGGDRQQLVFGVYVADTEGEFASLPVRFDDGSAEGYTPVQGLSYGGATPPP